MTTRLTHLIGLNRLVGCPQHPTDMVKRPGEVGFGLNGRFLTRHIGDMGIDGRIFPVGTTPEKLGKSTGHLDKRVAGTAHAVGTPGRVSPTIIDAMRPKVVTARTRRIFDARLFTHARSFTAFRITFAT